MGFSWTTFFFELINFVLFLWLLERMLYAPLRRAIARRREAQEQAEQRVNELLERALTLEAEQSETRRELSGLRDNVLGDAREQAERERAAILKRAEGELLDLRRRAEERLSLERSQVESESARATLQAARRVVESLLRALLLPEVNSAMKEQLFAELDRDETLLRGVENEVQVCSAAPLDEKERTELAHSLEHRLGTGTRVTFLHDPELLAGFSLRVGNRLYDASLRAQLQAVYERAERELGRASDGEAPSVESTKPVWT